MTNYSNSKSEELVSSNYKFPCFHITCGTNEYTIHLDFVHNTISISDGIHAWINGDCLNNGTASHKLLVSCRQKSLKILQSTDCNSKLQLLLPRSCEQITCERITDKTKEKKMLRDMMMRLSKNFQICIHDLKELHGSGCSIPAQQVELGLAQHHGRPKHTRRTLGGCALNPQLRKRKSAVGLVFESDHSESDA